MCIKGLGLEAGNKRIFIDASRCTGCHLCEIACSMAHHSICNPQRSRIRIHEFKNPEQHIPILCQACDGAPCIKVCPVNARVREANQTVITDEDRCIGCRACLYICHLGSPVINPSTSQTMTCNLCAHEKSGPWCVAACRDEGALQLVDCPEYAHKRALKQALKLSNGKPSQ